MYVLMFFCFCFVFFSKNKTAELTALICCMLLFQKDYECTFTYASQGGTNEVSVLILVYVFDLCQHFPCPAHCWVGFWFSGFLIFFFFLALSHTQTPVWTGPMTWFGHAVMTVFVACVPATKWLMAGPEIFSKSDCCKMQMNAGF